MKRILILQHAWDNHKGYVGQVLDNCAIPYDVIDVEHEIIPDAKQYAAVIALGGSQHIYAIDHYPYLVRERAMLYTIVEDDMPFLGSVAKTMAASTYSAASTNASVNVRYWNLQTDSST